MDGANANRNSAVVLSIRRILRSIEVAIWSCHYLRIISLWLINRKSTIFSAAPVESGFGGCFSVPRKVTPKQPPNPLSTNSGGYCFSSISKCVVRRSAFFLLPPRNPGAFV